MSFLKRIFGRVEKMKSEGGPLWGATDPGRVRELNEDYFLILPEKNLLIVADGMGGHNAGEVASLKAVEEVDAYFTAELLSGIRGDPARIKAEMIKALVETNNKILDLAKQNAEHKGMGCTIVVGLIDDDTLHVCNVGDARAYVSRTDGIQQLTTDHSTVTKLVQAGEMTEEEARASNLRSELYQAIGAPMAVTPDYNRFRLQPGDRVLLCSDGLWDMVQDEEIHQVLQEQKWARAMSERMIEAANQAGGKDNITVVVSIHQDQGAATDQPERPQAVTEERVLPQAQDSPDPEDDQQ